MIIAESEIHHRAHYHCTVHCDRALHDFVHTQNSALWRIQNWRAQERAINAAVRNGKTPALQLLNFQFSFARLLRVIGDIPLQLGEGRSEEHTSELQSRL